MMIRNLRISAGTFAVLMTACSAQPSETDGLALAETAPAATARPATPAPAPVAEPSPAAVPAALIADGGSGRATETPTAAEAGAATSAESAAQYRDITIPAGTALPIDLRTSVASDTSHVEDRVSAALRRSVSVRGVEVLPAGTVLVGHVTQAARSAKVKGRGRVAFRFTSLDLPGTGGRTAIRTSAVARQAPATKKQDAAKIGGGAAGGAVIGAILGGGGGAAKGAAIGGAAGTGVVLSTRGKEVRVPAGTNLIVTLQAPITVRVRR